MLKAVVLSMSILVGWTSQALAEPLKIHASHGVIADFARQIGAENVVVTMPVPVGTDPAQWVPGIAEITAMQEADLILLNGAGYEGWADRVSLSRAKTVQTIRDSDIDLIRLPGVAHSHGDGPAHTHVGLAAEVWMDFAAATKQAEAIAKALTRFLPEHAETMANSLVGLKSELAALDDQARLLGAALDGQTLLVAQPGLEYFARAYGLDLIEATIDPLIPPSPEQWVAIDAIIAATDARFILWQSLPPEKTRAALEARGVMTAVFDIGTNPAVGTSFTALMRQNMSVFQTATKQQFNEGKK